MVALFDDVSRVIASPMSRRLAFKRIAWTLAGGALALEWPRHVYGQPAGCIVIGDYEGSTVGARLAPFLLPGQTCANPDDCDPAHCCPAPLVCCTTRAHGITCSDDIAPCNTLCCPPGVDCLDSFNSLCCTASEPKFCMDSAQGAYCCPAGNGGTAAGAQCCGGVCCKPGCCCIDANLCVPCPSGSCCCVDPANPKYNKCIPSGTEPCMQRQPGQSIDDMQAQQSVCLICSGNGSGGGKFLDPNSSVSLLRISFDVQTTTPDPTSFSAGDNISGSLVAFDFATWTEIESTGFSFLNGTVAADGGITINGVLNAQVNGVSTDITLLAYKQGDSIYYEIRDADTSILIMGGAGEGGRAALDLQILTSTPGAAGARASKPLTATKSSKRPGRRPRRR